MLTFTQLSLEPKMQIVVSKVRYVKVQNGDCQQDSFFIPTVDDSFPAGEPTTLGQLLPTSGLFLDVGPSSRITAKLSHLPSFEFFIRISRLLSHFERHSVHTQSHSVHTQNWLGPCLPFALWFSFLE